MFEFLINKLKAHPRKIVFTEGTDPRILEASARLLSGTFLTPVLVGNPEAVMAAAEEAGFNIRGAEIIDPETFAEMDNPMFKAKRILEINPHHDLFARLQTLHEAGKDTEDFKDYCDLLYTQALIIEGIMPENPIEFANKVAKLMAK